MQAIIAILLQGVTVANPKAWQTGQVTGTVLGGLILALLNAAHAYGFALPVSIDTATANEAGAALLTLFNIGMSAASHAHIGIIPEDRK
jgi:hypothetical protein